MDSGYTDTYAPILPSPRDMARYASWRFHVWQRIGTMTYREIDEAVSKGELTPGRCGCGEATCTWGPPVHVERARAELARAREEGPDHA